MHQRSREDGDDGHLDFLLLDLLAHVFGRAPDHQAADEDGDDGINQHAVEPRADASENHFVGLDVEQRNQPAERREAVVHAVHRAATGIRGDGGEQRGLRDAEPHFLAFHVAARLAARVSVLDAQLSSASDCRAARPNSR